MADVQTEKGFTRIANDLLDAFMQRDMSGAEFRIVLAFARETYGWNRSEADVSITRIVEMTKINRRTAQRMRSHLQAQGILNYKSIIKDFDKWGQGGRSNDRRSNDRRLNDHRSNGALGGGQTVLKGAVSTPPPLLSKDSKDSKDTAFAALWSEYPKKDGRKEALRHFKTSVKNSQDWDNIRLALKNYKKSTNVFRGFIKNGSTWFNNWQDWVNPTPEMMNDQRVAGESREI